MDLDNIPPWNRHLIHNLEGLQRNEGKWHNYDVKLTGHIWSLWSSMHSKPNLLQRYTRGRHYIACCIIASCVAHVYKRLSLWNRKLLDAIIVHGDRYYYESVLLQKNLEHQLTIEQHNANCTFSDLNFFVKIDLIVHGRLYCITNCGMMNLSEALNYFFLKYQHGVLICQRRAIAIGFSVSHGDGGYYLYDCQGWDGPIYPTNMGASYLLRTKKLAVLHYCILLTLNERKKNICFDLYNIEVLRKPNILKIKKQ